MTTQQKEDKSITQQIIEETFAKLAVKNEYPETVISKLKNVAANGNLTSSKSVIEAISIVTEEPPRA